MRSKKFFLIFLSALLLIMSLICGNYSKNTIISKKEIDSYILNFGDKQQLFLYHLIEEYDSDYTFIEFSDNVTSEVQNQINKNLNGKKDDLFEQLIDDENMVYKISKVNNYGTHSVIMNPYNINSANINEDEILLQTSVSFNKQGQISCSGDFCTFFKNNDLTDFIPEYLYSLENDRNKYVTSDNHSIDVDDVIFNNPKGYIIEIYLFKNLTPGGYIYPYFDNQMDFFIYLFIVTCVAFILLLSFILFTPIQLLQEIKPYKIIKNWLLEVNMFVFSVLFVAIGYALAIIHYTANSRLIDNIAAQYNPQVSSFIVDGVTTLLWFLFFLIITIILFLLKYMITSNLIIYLKEHTLLGLICQTIKRNFNSIKTNHRMILVLLAFIITNGLVLLFLSTTYNIEFRTFLFIVYSTILFAIFTSIGIKINNHYRTLLYHTNSLAKGRFDLKIEEDLSIFNEYKEELLQVKEGFEKAVQEEVKASNLRTELITNVSHDLKTPITCIKNYVTLLEDENLNEETRKEYVSNLHQYTDRLTHLVEDLFEVSKVNSNNVSLDLIELDIVDLVKQVLAENGDLLTNSNLTVISRLPEEHIQVTLDSEKTYRIFENLITNISKYALPYSRVYVDVQNNDEDVTITFKNISKDEMNFTSEEIVERFVRGDKSRHEQGSGLGLAIVKSYTEIQNGIFNITIDGDLFKAILTFKK